MSVTQAQHQANQTTTSLNVIWQEIKTHLEKQKKQIYQEIVNYPPPIPACDVQFNHLLEERARVTQELSRARKSEGKGSNHRDSVKLIFEFIKTSAYIDDALKTKFISDLTNAQLKQESQ